MTDRDCKHGQLARQCDRCELDGEVERLWAFVAAWDAWLAAIDSSRNGDRQAKYNALMAAREAVGVIESRK